MSRQRRYRLHPPATAASVTGVMFEFTPTDDRVPHQSAETVELTPTGTAGTGFEFTPADDRVTRPPTEAKVTELETALTDAIQSLRKVLSILRAGRPSEPENP